MKRSSLALCAVSLVPWALGAQTAAPVYKDPHHQMVLYTDQFRILDVNLPAGETGREHYHDRDIATVAIAGALTRTKRAGEDWSGSRDRPRGSMNVTEFTDMPESHTIQNVDKIPYRIIAVENLRQGKWSAPPPLQAPATMLTRQTRAFALYDVRLDAATPETEHNHELPAITILVNGAIEMQGRRGAEPSRLQQSGRWLYTPMGTAHTLRIAAGSLAHAVEFEVR